VREAIVARKCQVIELKREKNILREERRWSQMELAEQAEAAALQKMSAEGSLKTIRNKSRYAAIWNFFSLHAISQSFSASATIQSRLNTIKTKMVKRLNIWIILSNGRLEKSAIQLTALFVIYLFLSHIGFQAKLRSVEMAERSYGDGFNPLTWEPVQGPPKPHPPQPPSHLAKSSMIASGSHH
jgi:hypothetical protein